MACFDPFDTGLKATFSVNDFPGLIVLLPPPLVSLNIDASGPTTDVAIVRLDFPLFSTLKEEDLLLFTPTFPKS